MSILTPAAGLAAAALLATSIALPLAAAGPAAAACEEGVRFAITDHKRAFYRVSGTKISFNDPGTHTIKITKATTLTARYNTGDRDDQRAIRKAVQVTWPKVRHQVDVTTGHKRTFSTDAYERVTVVYGSSGDRVNWTKLAVDDDCSTTVLDEGWAKFPRRNLNWLFAIAVS